MSKIHLTTQDNETLRRAEALLKPLGITYFMYYINYLDGSEFKCTNRPDWVAHFIEKQFYKKSIYTKPPKHYGTGFYFASSIEDAEIITTAKEQFNIDNIVTWFNPLGDDCELFHFGSDKGNAEVTNLYLNHQQLLLRFIFYFKNEVGRHLKQTRLLIPQRFSHNDNELATLGDDAIAEFVKQTKVTHFEIGGEFKGVSLTSRELECLSQTAQGKTAKEIAKELSISFRTVELHISNIKSKLGFTSKSELIQFAKAQMYFL